MEMNINIPRKQQITTFTGVESIDSYVTCGQKISELNACVMFNPYTYQLFAFHLMHI